jgi:hypothetical protein
MVGKVTRGESFKNPDLSYALDRMRYDDKAKRARRGECKCMGGRCWGRDREREIWGPRRRGGVERETRESLSFHRSDVWLIGLQGFGAEEVGREVQEDEVAPEDKIVNFVHGSISERASDESAIVLVEAMHWDTKQNLQILWRRSEEEEGRCDRGRPWQGGSQEPERYLFHLSLSPQEGESQQEEDSSEEGCWQQHSG